LGEFPKSNPGIIKLFFSPTRTALPIASRSIKDSSIVCVGITIDAFAYKQETMVDVARRTSITTAMDLFISGYCLKLMFQGSEIIVIGFMAIMKK